MRDARRLTAAVLMAAFVALPAMDAYGQKEKKPALPGAGKVDSAKWASGTYAGKLKSTPGSERTFDLEIKGGGGSWVTVEFQLAEKAKVRTTLLPEAFDDKGNPKKYTKKELSDLKGADKASPGYESAVEKLEAGQMVQVTLGVAPRPAAGAKKKDDDTEAEKPLVEKAKQVKMVVILSSPEGGGGGGPAVPKKKK